MLAAPIPDNESARLDSLRRMLRSCAPDAADFDRVTRAAQRLFDTPIALISLVERDRQWFKSCLGLSVRESPRDVSFCGHAIVQDRTLVVEDALADPRFADNPLVTREPGIRFYAGRPLRNSENFTVGALCVIDRKPRTPTPDELQLLDDLGRWAEGLFAAGQLGEAHSALLSELEDARRARMMDPTLHVWSRWAIVDLLERETVRARRHRDPLAVLMVELEFPPAEDEPAGQSNLDGLREEAARVMRHGLRPYDAIGQYSAGDFLVVLPNSDREAATGVAQRLHDRIGSAQFSFGTHRVRCSVRTGAACLDPLDARPAETLVARAEYALRGTGQSRCADAGRKDNHAPAVGAGDDLPGTDFFARKLRNLRVCAAEE